MASKKNLVILLIVPFAISLLSYSAISMTFNLIDNDIVAIDWNYQDEPKKLLLQFDPLDPGLGIFEYVDGLFYFFFDEKEGNNFEKVILMEEFS